MANNQEIKNFLDNYVQGEGPKKYYEQFFNDFPQVFQNVKKEINSTEGRDVVVTIQSISKITEDKFPQETNLSTLKHTINFFEVYKKQVRKDVEIYRFHEYLIFFCEKNSKDAKYILYNVEEGTMSYQNYHNLRTLIESYISSRLFYDVYNYFEVDVYNDKAPEFEKNKRLDILLRRKTIFVNEIDYIPKDELLVINNKSLVLNKFKTGEYFSYFKEKKVYEFPWISEFIYFLCGENGDVYDWFIKWLAWKLQNPCHKPPTAMIFSTPQGAGKDLFETEIISKIWGRENIRSLSGDAALAGWADTYTNSLFVFINEIAFKRNADYQEFKLYVSNSKIDSRKKHKDSELIENYSNVIIFSNFLNSIKIEQDDRRFTVAEVNMKRSKEYYINLIDQIPKEMADFTSYLKSINVDYKEISDALDTPTKREIQNIHRHPVYKFLTTIKDEGLEEIQQNIITKVRWQDVTQHEIPVYKVYTLFIDFMKHWNIPQNYQISSDKFSKMLSEMGIKSYVKRTDKGTQRVFSIYDFFQKSKNESNEEEE